MQQYQKQDQDRFRSCWIEEVKFTEGYVRACDYIFTRSILEESLDGG